jgi:hypothetical protein
MKRYAIISIVAALTLTVALAGCAKQVWVMDDADHKLLTETRDQAVQAKDAAAQSATDAKAARETAEQALAAAQKADADAQRAEADAQASSTKADRMFAAGQNK